MWISSSLPSFRLSLYINLINSPGQKRNNPIVPLLYRRRGGQQQEEEGQEISPACAKYCRARLFRIPPRLPSFFFSFHPDLTCWSEYKKRQFTFGPCHWDDEKKKKETKGKPTQLYYDLPPLPSYWLILGRAARSFMIVCPRGNSFFFSFSPTVAPVRIYN